MPFVITAIFVCGRNNRITIYVNTFRQYLFSLSAQHALSVTFVLNVKYKYIFFFWFIQRIVAILKKHQKDSVDGPNWVELRLSSHAIWFSFYFFFYRPNTKYFLIRISMYGWTPPGDQLYCHLLDDEERKKDWTKNHKKNSENYLFIFWNCWNKKYM